MDAIKIILGNRYLVGKTFSVSAKIYLGAKQKGDVDNFGKLILDGLHVAGTFRNDKNCILSDSWVTELSLCKYRDAKNPRTEILVQVIP